MPLPKHLCFDLDGTLTTVSNDYPKTIVSQTFNTLGLSEPTEKDVHEIWFGADKDNYIQQVLKRDVPTFWKVFDLFDTPEERVKQTVLFPDVVSTLTELKVRGHILSILSGALPWHIEQALEKMKGVEFSETLAISYSGYPNKPDPGALYALLKKLELSPSETVYVGNGAEDLLLTRNAECDFIYVNRNKQTLPLREDEKEISTLKELL